MNQQQLNKIDEELDGFFSSKYFNVEKWKYSSYVAQFKDFLHSKLQEAYELGRRDERERIIDIVKELKQIHFDHQGDVFKEIINSLQTNKE